MGGAAEPLFKFKEGSGGAVRVFSSSPLGRIGGEADGGTCLSRCESDA